MPADRRARYELSISLESETVTNPLSGQKEIQQVLVVDDCGIGMDREVIERYFLQVGRSYYTTESFRRTFPFHPISRFGIGFLSVFAVSDHVTVETLRSHGGPSAEPIRLTLTGPRSYLLVERAARTMPGTRISVRLRQPLVPGRLTNIVRGLCRRVEFAITMREHGAQKTIVAEQGDRWACELPDPSEPGATVAVRAFSIAEQGVQGELYVLARVTEQGESWAEASYIKRLYQRYPFASLPPDLAGYVCQQGLLRYNKHHVSNFGFRVDDRRQIAREVLDRANRRGGQYNSAKDVLDQVWWTVVTEHLRDHPLTKGPDGWRYVHCLVEELDVPWWPRVPETTPVWIRGEKSRRSLAEVLESKTFTTIIGLGRLDHDEEVLASRVAGAEVECLVLFSDELFHFADELRARLFEKRRSSVARWITSSALAVTWTTASDTDVQDTCEFPDPAVIGIGHMDELLLNPNNPLVQWASWARTRDIPGAREFWNSLKKPFALGPAQHLLRQYLAASLECPPPDVQIINSCYLVRLQTAGSGE